MFVKGRFSADKTYPYINHFLTTIPLPMLANVFPGEWSKTFDRKSDINPHHR
ncbi:MAG: hypothetical protein LBD75_01305 [Candidatus Peribacteria bacterium]|nr:hypothetical protein [Candidatus Peribacteria bacterium]